MFLSNVYIVIVSVKGTKGLRSLSTRRSFVLYKQRTQEEICPTTPPFPIKLLVNMGDLKSTASSAAATVPDSSASAREAFLSNSPTG